MRFTSRDLKLIRDMALSHVLARDQIIALGYFGSVTRANTRLRELSSENLATRLSTPFFGQSLYAAGPKAQEVVGERISPFLAERASSPRFVQHALSVTNVRLQLLAKGATGWLFEQQLWRDVQGHTLKPDGLALTKSQPAFVEVDLGHVAPLKVKEKLKTYQTLANSGQCTSFYGFETFRLVIVTTGKTRLRSLSSLLPQNPGFECLCYTFADLGVPRIESWS